MTLKALQIFVNVANIGTNLITSMNYYNVSPGRKRNLTEDPSAGVFNNHRPVSGLQGVEGAPAWILYNVINSSPNKIEYSQRMIKFHCRCFQ